MTKRRPIAALIALSLFAVACRSSVPPPPTDQNNQPLPTTSDGMKIPAALAFDAQALGGGRVRGADFAGKAVALWFWAPW